MSKIATLHESLRPFAEQLIEAAPASGIRLVVTEALRSSAYQAQLYAQGRTVPGPGASPTRPLGSIVTKAHPGSSWHEFGLAFDVAILEDGKATWPNDRGLWEEIGELGESLGLEWGGRFKTILDLPHFQRRGGLTLAEARAGKRPT